MILIEKSRESIWRSKSWTDIVYVPASITTEQASGIFAELLFGGANRIAALMNSRDMQMAIKEKKLLELEGGEEDEDDELE